MRSRSLSSLGCLLKKTVPNGSFSVDMSRVIHYSYLGPDVWSIYISVSYELFCVQNDLRWLLFLFLMSEFTKHEASNFLKKKSNSK